MPLSLHELQEIGLNDWPAWFRSLNSGYFASESHFRPTPRRAKGRVCNGVNGCCRDVCRGGINLSATHVRAESLRVAGKEKTKENVAEQVVAKLNGMVVKEEKDRLC